MNFIQTNNILLKTKNQVLKAAQMSVEGGGVKLVKLPTLVKLAIIYKIFHCINFLFAHYFILRNISLF